MARTTIVAALLLCGVAMCAAQAQITVADLPKQLQQLNQRLATIASTGKGKKASAASLLASVEEYESDYEPKHKYEKEYKPKHKKEYKDEYEKEDKYEDKYESKGYGYDYPKKVTTKLYEKFRSHLRPQALNKDTFQFTSELTCQNPKGENGPDHEDGIINFPVVSERMKLVTVGVCEWTVTEVKEQRISEHASLKGSTNVVCTFSEEAERYCKNGEILEKGLTISGQGLVYNFEHEPETYEAKAAAEAVAPEAEGIDVYLTMINGVVNAGKKLPFDNGALQFFFGTPAVPEGEKGGRDASVRGAVKKGDPTGDYTLVFKA